MKRYFDILCSFIGLLILWPVIFFGWLLSTFSLGSNGFFFQKRIGLHGVPFYVVKIKTMTNSDSSFSPITALNTNRITRVGCFLRKYKIDELPQLINVLFGSMSLVGPRPDVPGYADKLDGDDRAVLSIRPGITGLATISFKNEEELLAGIPNPIEFNDKVIYPLKTKLNIYYINHWSLKLDLDLIFQTIIGVTFFNEPIKPFLNPQDCIDKLGELNVKQ